MANVETARACAETLHDFYCSFKEADEHIRFIFITGISQFARLAIGQSPNNFKDISLMPEFADACGFTADDLDALFKDRYEETLASLKESGQLPSSATQGDMRQKILEWYDGYNFGGKPRLLNPISILNFFSDRKFSGYWIETGPPSFLKTLIAKNPRGFIQANLKGYSDSGLKQIDLSSPGIVPVLFQTGYLTIESETFSETLAPRYSFKVPNLEVADSLGEVIMQNVFGFGGEEREKMAGRLKAAIESREAKELETIFETALRKISNQLHHPKEYFYHSAILMFLYGLSVDVRPEASSGLGRSDIDIVLPGGIYASIEVKYRAQSKALKQGLAKERGQRLPGPCKKALAEEKERLLSEAALEAIAQCLDRGYTRQYRLEAREIVNIGLGVYHRVDVKVLLELPEPAGEEAS
jgi:hypothetical protein